MRVEWSPRAIKRATEIAKHIAKHDRVAAESWVDAVFDKADQVPPFPRRGADVPETDRADILQVFHGKYRIIYRFDDEVVEVLTVRHSAQQLRSSDIPDR